MERISKALEGSCGGDAESIQSSIFETSRLLDVSTLQVCRTILERVADRKLKVISWNCLADIWNGDTPTEGKLRFQRIIRTLKTLVRIHDPDIIMLQEITKNKYRSLVKILKGYTSHISYHSKCHWEDQLKLPYQPNGVCIFAKKKLEPVIFSDVSLGGGNVAGAIKFSMPSGYTIHITNVHLNDRDVHHIREIEVSKILGMADSNTTYVIGGDLNSPPSDQIHHLLTSRGFETVCFKQCEIDYIYVKKGKRLEGVLMVPLIVNTDPTTSIERLIRENGSDHPPIGTEIFLF
jgi:mRNA deadenylase 3'-5' endonuclease subunit Ccr4